MILPGTAKISEKYANFCSYGIVFLHKKIKILTFSIMRIV